MATVRVTNTRYWVPTGGHVGRVSRTPGEQLSVQVNTFGIDKLLAITGEDLIGILRDALGPAYQEAWDNWAFLTGASRDSLEIATTEVGPRVARAALQAGGDKLRGDSRNPRGIDYAPFLEFNGSPSGSQAPGVLVRAVLGNDADIRAAIHAGVAKLIQERLR